jgi:hypothetical protein
MQKFRDEFGGNRTFSDDKDTENFEKADLVVDFSFLFDEKIIITEREVFHSVGADDDDLFFEEVGTGEHWL